jgi:hypothetical protein
MISHVELASLAMATGDPREGIVIGHRALDAANRVRSSRAADDLRELARYTTRHAQMRDVADLRRRITTVVCQS